MRDNCQFLPSLPRPQSSRKLGPRWKCWKCVNFSLKGIEKILSGRKRLVQQLISPLIRQDNHQFYKEHVLDRERGKAGRVLPTWLLESCTFLLGNLQFRNIASLIDFLHSLYFFPKMWQIEALKIIFGDIFLIRPCPWMCEDVLIAMPWMLLYVLFTAVMPLKEIFDLTFSFEPLVSISCTSLEFIGE